jgi:molecular chaperone GrpE
MSEKEKDQFEQNTQEQEFVENGNPEIETDEQVNSDDKSANDHESDQSALINELKDKYLRLFAEFENFRKRTARETLENRKVASADTLAALLPVLDDFDRAKKNADDPSSPEQFSEGIELVYHKLIHTLQQKGLKKMDTFEVSFNPELHEAITEIPVQDDSLKGKIIDTVEPGYYLNDKILRYAKVVVGK